MQLFGPKGDEVTEQRKLHSEELHIFYSSPNIIRQIKSIRMRWADMWHAWERGGMCIRSWWESQKEGDHLEEQDSYRMHCCVETIN
jgi:hypothetical protein